MIVLAFSIAGAVFAAGYIVGSFRGEKYGRDAQWVDSYFDGVRKEQERRDARGRFKRKEEQP